MGEVEPAGWRGRLNAAVSALSWEWTAVVIAGSVLVTVRYLRGRTVGLGAQALAAVLTDAFGRLSGGLGVAAPDDAEALLFRLAAGSAVVLRSLALNLLGTVLVVAGALRLGSRPREGVAGR